MFYLFFVLSLVNVFFSRLSSLGEPEFESSSSEKFEAAMVREMMDLERVVPNRLKTKKFAIDKSTQLSAK